MAKTITQKNIRRNGTQAQGVVTYFVTGGETLVGTDFQFPSNDGTGETLTFTPRVIDYVVNTGTASVTIDSKPFGPGSWDLYQVGGVPVSGPSVAVGAGTIIVQLRS